MNSLWIVLVDVSGSMGEPFSGEISYRGYTEEGHYATKLEAAKDRLLKEIASFTSGDIAVIKFANKPEVICKGSARDYNIFVDPIQSLIPQGRTNIASAILFALNDIGDLSEYKIVSILLITDGLSNEGDPAATTSERRDKSIMMTTILIDPTSRGMDVAEAISDKVIAVTSSQQFARAIPQAIKGHEDRIEEAKQSSRLVRFPSLDAPAHVVVGKPFVLKVGLEQMPEPGTSGLVVVENLPSGQDSFRIEFEVLSGEFLFAGNSSRGELIVERDNGKACAELILTPLSIEGKHRLSDLNVVFLYDGKICGRACRSLMVVADETVIEDGLLSAVLEKKESLEEPPLQVVFGAKVPDLEFSLFKSSSEIGVFDCYVHSHHLTDLPRRYLRSTLNLGLSPDRYISNLYKRMIQQQAGLPLLNCFSALGGMLYDIAPDCFKKAYWKLHDTLGEQFETIQIYSDEPWIPWELMKPYRETRNGITESHSYLGMEKKVGRWLNQQAGAPPQSIHADQITVVAPEYPRSPLRFAKQEAIWLMSQYAASEVKPATKANVIQFLQEGKTNILHFSCHGKAYEDSNVGEILLEDYALSAYELKSLEIRSGLTKKCQPVVFINACESGRTGVTLGGIGGLASALVDISCSAVIGTWWSVDDRDASEVAKIFYSRLSVGDPVSIADVMREIRQEFERRERDTFLAYTFFGDPHATVSFMGQSTRRGGR